MDKAIMTKDLEEFKARLEEEDKRVKKYTDQLWDRILKGDVSLEEVAKVIADTYNEGFIAGVRSEVEILSKIGVMK